MPKKAHVKAVREALAKKLGIGERRIYAKAKDLGGTLVSPEDGIYLLAAHSGIKLNNFLPKDKVEKIRELSFKLNQQPVSRVYQYSTQGKTSTSPKPRTIRIGKEFNCASPILPNKILEEAKKMAENVYPLLYVLENSIREVILRVMKGKYGANWWDTKVHKDIKKTVQDRKNDEQKNPWHGPRGAHEIYYTDLEHLQRIVQNNWCDFEAILPDQQWFTQRLKEISKSRNPVAHMNPLNPKDIKRIEVYYRDWQDQIKNKRSEIPQ